MNHRERAIKTIQEAVEAVTNARVEIGRLDESATIEQIKAAQTACVDAMMSCSEASGACSAYRVQRTIAASDSELGLDGALAALQRPRGGVGGGPINAKQRAEVEAQEIDDEPKEPITDADIRRAKAHGYDIGPDEIGHPSENEDQDAADAAIVAAEQDRQVRRTAAATREKMGT